MSKKSVSYSLWQKVRAFFRKKMNFMYFSPQISPYFLKIRLNKWSHNLELITMCCVSANRSKRRFHLYWQIY